MCSRALIKQTLAIASVLLLAACGGQQQDRVQSTSVVTAEAGTARHFHYRKPGAPVFVKHQIKGDIWLGREVTLILQLSGAVGTTRVKLQAPEGLVLESEAGALQWQFTESQWQQPIAVTVVASGRHYLNVLIESTVKGSRLTRSYSIPLQARDSVDGQQNSNHDPDQPARQIIQSEDDWLQVETL